MPAPSAINTTRLTMGGSVKPAEGGLDLGALIRPSPKIAMTAFAFHAMNE